MREFVILKIWSLYGLYSIRSRRWDTLYKYLVKDWEELEDFSLLDVNLKELSDQQLIDILLIINRSI